MVNELLMKTERQETTVIGYDDDLAILVVRGKLPDILSELIQMNALLINGD